MTRLRFDEFEVDPQSCELLRRGQALELQNQPVQVLLVLLENPGTLVTRESLRQRIWPTGVHLNFDHSLNRSMNKLREALGDSAEAPRYIETLPGRGYRFKGHIERTKSETDSANGMANVRAALPIDSRYYIARDADSWFDRALQRNESVVLLTGPRQSGKTSLLARALEGSRGHGFLAVSTDLGKLNPERFSSLSQFMMALADDFAQQCNATVTPDACWIEQRSACANFDRYLKQVLDGIRQPVIWAIDEADRLFSTDFANDLFALVRSWHNERALRPESPVHRLTVAIAYAREAHLFISDENQSPFNVGTKIALEDFSLNEIAELNAKYGSPLTPEQTDGLFEFTGGHPLLTHGGLQAISLGEFSLADLIATGSLHEGPFGGHLRRLLRSLKRNAALTTALKAVMKGDQVTPEQIYELRASGVLAGHDNSKPRPRCQLYDEFLRRELP